MTKENIIEVKRFISFHFLNETWTSATSTQLKSFNEALAIFLKMSINIHTWETPRRSDSFNADLFGMLEVV